MHIADISYVIAGNVHSYSYEQRLEEHERSRWGWGGRDRIVRRRGAVTRTLSLMYGAGQTASRSIP
jgi:hypothetical protein